MTTAESPGHASTYADRYRDATNETYSDTEVIDCLDLEEGEGVKHAVSRVLSKAADALRYGGPATFTGPELDLVRHLMPAHEVHQSGSVRWVHELYGYCGWLVEHVSFTGTAADLRSPETDPRERRGHTK